MGKVKSRLAATIGQQAALEVYKKLLIRTREVTIGLDCDKFLFYSEKIEEDDWPKERYHKVEQQGKTLGDRIRHAFNLMHQKGYGHTIIIGSDCYDINQKLIESAFDDLEHDDLVVGPANDGGYYLLGTNGYFPSLFEEINWSTTTVLRETIEKAKALNLKTKFKEELVDLDTFDDLKKSGFPLNSIKDVRENKSSN